MRHGKGINKFYIDRHKLVLEIPTWNLYWVEKKQEGSETNVCLVLTDLKKIHARKEENIDTGKP